MLTKISIVVDNSAELELLEDITRIFEEFEVKYNTEIISFYYNTDGVMDFAKSARKNSYEVIIATGANLPAMIASLTSIPVIRFSISDYSVMYYDELPISTMNVAKNIAIYALEILANSDERIHLKLEAYKEIMKLQIKKTI